MASGESRRTSGPAERVISVEAIAGGWRVKPGACEALMFLSGGSAERQARTLAEHFARLGFDARVEIRDRSHAIACDQLYPAARQPPV